MLTGFLLASGIVLILALCGGISYRIGYRHGREQGLTDSYLLYGLSSRVEPVGKQPSEENIV